MYTDKAGNRKLNKAIHTIALSQIGNQGNLKSKEYYQRKKKGLDVAAHCIFTSSSEESSGDVAPTHGHLRGWHCGVCT